MYRDRDRAITRSFFKLRIGIGISILFFRFIAIGIAIPKFEDRLQACSKDDSKSTKVLTETKAQAYEKEQVMASLMPRHFNG